MLPVYKMLLRTALKSYIGARAAPCKKKTPNTIEVLKFRHDACKCAAARRPANCYTKKMNQILLLVFFFCWPKFQSRKERSRLSTRSPKKLLAMLKKKDEPSKS